MQDESGNPDPEIPGLPPVATRDAKGRWEKGASGNPKGRPKKQRLATLVADRLQQPIRGEGTKSGMEALADEFVKALTSPRRRDHMWFLEQFLVREWPATQKVDVNHGVEIAPETQAWADRQLEAIERKLRGEGIAVETDDVGGDVDGDRVTH